MPGLSETTRQVALLRAPGNVDHVLELVAQGRTVADIAAEMGCANLAVHDVLNNPVRAKRVAEARRAGAAALAEQTLAIAEGALPTVHPVTGELVVDPARDKMRIQTRQWMAERRDRATWGTAKEGVTINIAGLHLDALRARPATVEAADTIYIEQSPDADIGEDYDSHPLFG
jgi:hypothetical protein